MINVFYPINSLTFTIISIPDGINPDYYCSSCNNNVHRSCDSLVSSGGSTICGVINAKTKGMMLFHPLIHLSIYNIMKFSYNEEVS